LNPPFDIFGKNIIHLDNYKGASWELQEVSFDEWSQRFVYSVLLSFNLLTVTHEKRMSLIDDFGTNEFLIGQPAKKSGEILETTIIYRKEHDNFHFKA